LKDILGIGLIKVDLKDGLGIGLIKVDLKDGLVDGMKENFIKNIYLIVKYHLSIKSYHISSQSQVMYSRIGREGGLSYGEME